MHDGVRALRRVPDDMLLASNAVCLCDIGRTASFLDIQAAALCRCLSRATGIGEDIWSDLVSKHVGLPADSILKRLLEHTVCGWLPALASGYLPCSMADAGYRDIPQTVLVGNGGPEPDSCRWNLSMLVEAGPDFGTELRVRLSERMAASVLRKAVGIRLVAACSRPRPYDLHRMRLAVGLTADQHGHPSLANVFECSGLRAANRRLMHEYVGKCPRNSEREMCFDCGASPDKCSRSRHTNMLEKGTCLTCGSGKYRLNLKGVCVACVQRYVTTGAPLVVRAQP